MKLFGNTRNKITKEKNREIVSDLEITDLVLAYCNLVNNDYINMIQKSCIHLSINTLVNC